MKIKKLLPILSVTIALAFYGCKKSNPAPKVSNLVTFTLQGQKYTVNTTFLVTVQSTNNLNISCVNQGGPGANILIYNYQQGTNFSLYEQSYVNLETSNTSGNSYSCDKGQLTISSLTQTHISGTFSGTAVKVGDNTYTEIPVSGAFDADIPQ